MSDQEVSEIASLPQADFGRRRRPRYQFRAEGEPAAVGQFIIERGDLETLKQIDWHPKVNRWMTGTHQSDPNLIGWAEYDMLFAIRGGPTAPEHLKGEVVGFINIYEVGEALQQRLLEKGVINQPSTEMRPLYEASFAIHPDLRYQSGLVSSALRQACLLMGQRQTEVHAARKSLDTSSPYPNALILAFVRPENVSSIRVLEHAGFASTGKSVLYHGNSKKVDFVYMLNWPTLTLRKEP